jgi:hypothetical protein
MKKINKHKKMLDDDALLNNIFSREIDLPFCRIQ